MTNAPGTQDHLDCFGNALSVGCLVSVPGVTGTWSVDSTYHELGGTLACVRVTDGTSSMCLRSIDVVKVVR